jgi:hypothetical protein
LSTNVGTPDRKRPTLEELQADLRADGAELIVESLTDGVARLRLVLRDADCAECIMPRQHLERIALITLRTTHPEINKVELLDPRETNPA